MTEDFELPDIPLKRYFNLADGFYLYKKIGEEESSLVLVFNNPDFEDKKYIMFGSWDTGNIMLIEDIPIDTTLIPVAITTSAIPSRIVESTLFIKPFKKIMKRS